MRPRTFSRRELLKVTGITFGAGVLACSGLTALATIKPAIKLPIATFGNKNLSRKVLIAYASKCGSTGEVGTVIGKTIAQNDVYVDVLPVQKVSDLASYQAVFVGSAIRIGKWLPEAIDFVNTNRAILQHLPTVYFTVCMTMVDDTPVNRTKAAGFIDTVRSTLVPTAEGYFAGDVDSKRLSFIEDTMLKVIGVPAGDFRNWEKIKDWTQSTRMQIYG
jgi:menaquinone-dependent protoporphyrinogen oxidase